MSRVIKFRAWNGEAMEFGGFSIHATGNTQPLEGLSRVKQDSPIMQFTGLTDWNGVEIFEGDIVRVVSLMNDHHQRGATSVLVAKIHMGNACLCFPETESGTPIYPLIVTHELKVIGNIYEHPHLIGRSSEQP